MPERIYIFGDSNADALVSALDKWQIFSEHGLEDIAAVRVDNGVIKHRFLVKLHDGTDVLNPLIESRFEDVGLFDRTVNEFRIQDATVCLCFGYGEQHALGYPPKNFAGFHFELNEATEPTERIYLDPEMLRAFERLRLANYMRGVKLLVDRGYRIAMLGGPPIGRDWIVKAYAPEATYGDEKLRKRIHDANNEVLAEAARSCGIPFIDANEGFADADGYILEHYAYRDGVHGNDVFGRDYLMRLVRYFGRTPYWKVKE